ncbi:hypothetical protein B0J14DRAFT_610003 [Halenospora varia]|nr:hypothetical protein B0J14DRAFT_610003 [Halenospora varia]
MGSKKSSKIGSKRRTACPVTICTSSFSRPSDLLRHQQTIHGPKTPCAHLGCKYATERVDKMKEHARKIYCSTEATNISVDNLISNWDPPGGQMELGVVKTWDSTSRGVSSPPCER